MAPKVVLLFSGKRKSGKDYLTDRLEKRLGENICEVVKISWPIKEHWAKEKDVTLDSLLSDGPLKEQHRLQMIEWSEEQRRQDPGRFCRAACDKASGKQVMIVSDVRRKTDIIWFKETYRDKVATVRIFADEESRRARGFEFVAGVDDAPSECDLDDYEEWNLTIDNSNGASLDEQLQSMADLIERT